jgi:cation-transporting ATPase G
MSSADRTAVGSRLKTPRGEHVIAGSINGSRTLDVEAPRQPSTILWHGLSHPLKGAQARKGQGQRLADRIASPLVPAVIVAAALVAGLGARFLDGELWWQRALVVLVAASPCALASAVPIAVVAAITGGSRLGVIVKGQRPWKRRGTIKLAALDKS